MTFTYEGQENPVIEQEAVFENDRQKVEVSVVKRDAETKAEVEGAVFGLYAKEDIANKAGEVIVKAEKTYYYYHLSDKAFSVIWKKDSLSHCVIPEVVPYED